MDSLGNRFRRLLPRGLEPPVVASERTTPRLLLRPYRMTDADDWLAIENDARVREGLRWPSRTPAEAIRHLRDRTRHTVLRQPGDFLVLAMEHQGRVIGDVSLHLRTVHLATRSVEIGWLLHTAFSGQGFATEAADGMLDFAFEEVEASIVTAVVRERNGASARLALRLGFRQAARTGGTTTYLLAREDRLQRSSRTDAAGLPGGTTGDPGDVPPPTAG